jgi:ribosomal protein S18 acetylase RimI-like enzyme
MMLRGKARIKGVFVLGEYRGLGVGTALTERLEAEAVKAGAGELEVYAHNPAFYEARGYKVVGANQFGVPLLRKTISRGKPHGG